MKLRPLFFLFGITTITLGMIGVGWSAGNIHETTKSPPRTGCSTVDVHCLCENPSRDFWVKDHKLRVNVPGEEPECMKRLDLEEFAKQAPLAVCLRDSGGQKDPRKPQSTCRVEWTCKKSCLLK